VIVRSIEGGNHFVMATDPKTFNTAVMECIEALDHISR
jgi:hypothetical protein